jgi:hypothetical protein
MRRAFMRALWVGPSEYRQRFRADSTASAATTSRPTVEV